MQTVNRVWHSCILIISPMGAWGSATSITGSRLIKHRDCTGSNIMMDACPIYPQGWHFKANICAPDGVTFVTPLARIDHPVRYYFIDYGVSQIGAAGMLTFQSWRNSNHTILSRLMCSPLETFSWKIFIRYPDTTVSLVLLTYGSWEISWIRISSRSHQVYDAWGSSKVTKFSDSCWEHQEKKKV